MSKRLSIRVVSLTVFFLIASLASRADPPAKNTDDQKSFPLLRQRLEARQIIAGKEVAPLMRHKLDCAKEILEGLALEDHQKIAKNAREMRLLSMEAGWKVIQTEEYMKQSADFRRSCELIENAAKSEDANRAALCYVALTVRCVECHSYLRRNKIILTSHQD